MSQSSEHRVSLPAEVTHAQAASCLDAVRRAILGAGTQPVVVDAAALTRFDSSCLAVLLACRREALARGQSLWVQAMPLPLQELADLYGVEALLAPAATHAAS